MDPNQIGNNMVGYIRTNAADLAAFALVAGGWTALAAAGPKVVTGVCLAGGGMVATAIVFEVTKGTVQLIGSAVKGMFKGVRDGFKKQPEQPVMRPDTATGARAAM